MEEDRPEKEIERMWGKVNTNVVLRSRAYCTVAELLGGADLWTDGTRIAWMTVSITVGIMI